MAQLGSPRVLEKMALRRYKRPPQTARSDFISPNNKMSPSLKQNTQPRLPADLDSRFGILKGKLVDPKFQKAVTASWKRLLMKMEEEFAVIAEAGSSYIPIVYWEDIVKNNYQLPTKTSKLFQERGTIMVKGVFDREQIDVWFNELQDFCKQHPETAGYTYPNPASWYNCFWTKPQTEARFHPNMQKMMNIFAHQFYVTDPSKCLLDLDSQVVYADRIRIREPGSVASLSMHVDSSSIERWEDDNYRATYKEIFEGRWEDWDAFNLDIRAYSTEDMYEDSGACRPTVCSSFRTLQGWLALSDNKSGEGTLKVLPNIKLCMAYVMLRPLFWNDPASGNIDDYVIDVETPKFPGAEPSYGQLFLSDDFYPHLKQKETCISIPDVEKGDFVYWHTDIPHEVDKEHNGNGHSSVFYYGLTPLSISNIPVLLDSRKSFMANKSPVDYGTQLTEAQREAEFQGADINNIHNLEGLRSMGLKEFDEFDATASAGQIRIRKLANEALRNNLFDKEKYLSEINSK